ncbi:hypothetical protein ACJ72_03436 [Emergomyces africanus]|uniref:Major facilitator superfamily (MFS) profile domain-containing protein n=1 Tax=Emergomyces africanus TaxID=1955775 RepID=A0A1B7NZL4_9EURO|nr:hypothetical protein ACJ72_03436 [Emergomyces africanus]
MAEPHSAHAAVTPTISPYRALPPELKAFTALIVSIATTFSGLATNIYFPVIPMIAIDLSVSSIGSASTIVVGAGVLEDITSREEQGDYMGFFHAGQMLPLAIGPILGGVFTDTISWRSIFWFLVIYSGVFLVFLSLLLPETLCSLVGNSSIPATGISKYSPMFFQPQQPQDSHQDPAQPFRASLLLSSLSPFVKPCGKWPSPLTLLFLNKATISNDTQLGLTYIANGVGCMISAASTGKLLDTDYQRIKNNYVGPLESFPLERAPLRTAWIWASMQSASLLIFGWTLDKKVHISVPIISTILVGWTTTSIQCVVFTFLVDVYPEQAATAAAALNLIRCLLGGGGAAALFPIIQAIGVGWTFTLLTGIAFLGLGFLGVQFIYGPGWRGIGQKGGYSGVDETVRGN